MAYVLNIPGLPPMDFGTVQEYNAFAAKYGIPPKPVPTAAPAPTGPTLNKRKQLTSQTRTGQPTTLTPCEVYEKAKAAGQSAAILEVHRKRCQTWQEAQAFAAAPPALSQDQLTIMATEQMPEETGMSTPVKFAIAAGALAIVGGIIWYATR